MAKTQTYEDEAVRLHALYKGKIQVVPKCPIQNRRDFSIWYTPGVAASCRAIEKNPEAVYAQTNRANSIAIVSDGSRVLGLGNIGPQAGLPVMEGKALLFKYLGGVDAIPICLNTQNEEEIIRTVELIQPSFGGINLEDISQPKCFRILDRLRETLSIPVWHDDQQGSATALLAGLLNALTITNRNPESVRIAMIGMGAANVASYRLLKAAGFKPDLIIACDSKGTLHRGRHDIEDQQHHFNDKWRVCCETNPRAVTGGIKEALRSADVCIAFSQPGPGVIRPEWVQGMAPHAIVFACANPVPEIWPDEARKAGAAIVATGRGDFPNQLNNSLVFPAMFRGVLDIRARTISNGMCIAAARELAQYASEQGIHPENILPQMDDCLVIARVAAAAAAQAQLEGLARIRKTREE
ncbi:MAG TPA: NADP-dependent malic enzyme, partial [Terriglobia bacterium]|nr:NADP-dependent malic enzyme [Terriglobia bacterium]